MSSWTPTKYKTRNWADYNFSLKQRGSLSIWFDPQMVWEAEASGRRGRQQTYSDAAIHACLAFKVLFGLPLRQTTGFVESLLKRAGLDWSVPDFSTLCRPLPGRRFASQICREGPENIISCHPVQGVSGAVTPIGGQHRHQS